jgi:two-component system, LytTR family, response regulator
MSGTCKLLIVDDEPLARRGLRLRIEQMRERKPGNTHSTDVEAIEIFEAANARIANEVLNKTAIQLMFVDIQMPGIDGLSLIRNLPVLQRPLVIITTAFQQYALDAFGVQAIDYLLKPVDAMALKRAWQRAMTLLGAAKTDASSDSSPEGDGKSKPSAFGPMRIVADCVTELLNKRAPRTK